MKRRFRSKEEEMEALRREPEFQALVKELKGQTPEQLERLDQRLAQEAAEEQKMTKTLVEQRIRKLKKEKLTANAIHAKLHEENYRDESGKPYSLSFVQDIANAKRGKAERMTSPKGSKISEPAPTSNISELTATETQAIMSEVADNSEKEGPTGLGDTRPDMTEFYDSLLTKTQPPFSKQPRRSEKSEVSDNSRADSAKPDISETTHKTMPEVWKRQIIQIVQTEIERFTQFQTIQTVQTAGEVELPPEPGKIDGDKGKKIALGERVKVAGTCDKRLYQLLEQWRRVRGIPFSRALDTALWHFLGKPALSFQATPEEPHLDD